MNSKRESILVAAHRTGDARTRIQDALRCELSNDERRHLTFISEMVELSWKSLHRMAEERTPWQYLPGAPIDGAGVIDTAAMEACPECGAPYGMERCRRCGSGRDAT